MSVPVIVISCAGAAVVGGVAAYRAHHAADVPAGSVGPTAGPNGTGSNGNPRNPDKWGGLKRAIQKGGLIPTIHLIDQMYDRDISPQQVVDAVKNGSRYLQFEYDRRLGTREHVLPQLVSDQLQLTLHLLGELCR